MPPAIIARLPNCLLRIAELSSLLSITHSCYRPSVSPVSLHRLPFFAVAVAGLILHIIYRPSFVSDRASLIARRLLSHLHSPSPSLTLSHPLLHLRTPAQDAERNLGSDNSWLSLASLRSAIAAVSVHPVLLCSPFVAPGQATGNHGQLLTTNR